MTVTMSRTALLAACFTVVFVAIVAAITAPAHAHAGAPHDTALNTALTAQQHGAVDDAHTAETCCHKTGTCIVQCLPAGPAVASLDTALTSLVRRFAAIRLASILSATDPPPPRA